MLPYDEWVDVLKFLRSDQLAMVELVNRSCRELINTKRRYWPLQRCYRLTFLEYYAVHTLARVPNLSDLPFQLPHQPEAQFPQLQLQPEVQVPLFLLDKPEPTFLLFEFENGRKFYIEFGPFLNAQNAGSVLFWLGQMANVFFEEEIRGLLDIRKFSPELLELLESNGLGKLLFFRCKTFGCYEYEAFDQLSVNFVLNHMSIQRMDKANGTIYSPQLLQLLHNGARSCHAFSTRWVMGCGQDFTDDLIQYALNTEVPEEMVPSIRLTPSYHRQRELPIPTRSLVSSPNIWLIKREVGDWHYEEWELKNVHKPGIHFRVAMYMYNDMETDEEAISQFSIERTTRQDFTRTLD